MSRSPSRTPVSFAALLVLSAGLAFTAILSVWLANADADKDMKALEHAADLLQTAFQEEIQDAIRHLSMINRMYSSANDLSRPDVHSLAMELVEHHPSIQAFSFARGVNAGGKTSYHVVDYITPVAPHAAWLAQDFPALPGRESALERARSSGRPSATGMFNLPSESGDHRAFEVIVPVYPPSVATGTTAAGDKMADGYTSIVLLASRLAENVLRRAALLHWPAVDIGVYVDTGNAQELVYRTGDLIDGNFPIPWMNPNWLTARAAPSTVRSVDINGMHWHIVTANSPAVAGHRAYAWVVLGGGATVSILLALYLQSLATRAADLARVNARLTEDIAARKRIESALRESEERFHRLADLSSDWYWEQDEELRFTLVSGETIFGCTPTRDLLGKARWELPLEVDERDFEAHTRLLKAHKPFSELEYRVRNVDGRVFWMSVSGEPFFDNDGNFRGYRGSGKDITARKEAELALRQSQTELRELAAHQSRVKEDERKRIAREIHDDLGQNLLVLHIDVSLLDEATRHSHPELNQRIRSLLSQVNNVIRSMRAIINELRPPVLDLGLQSAIEWQVQQFRQRSGVACTLEMDDGDIDGMLDEEAATSVFRILQESLTNVSRHAYASHVDIRLQRQYEHLVLEISDDGVGSFPGNMRKPRSFGLLGIRERVYTLGGEFQVTFAPGKGTTLTISIPASATSAAMA